MYEYSCIVQTVLLNIMNDKDENQFVSVASLYDNKRNTPITKSIRLHFVACHLHNLMHQPMSTQFRQILRKQQFL